MNNSLNKGGTGQLNLTNLLKNHYLEDDGIEDIHFYQVAFNVHRNRVLKKKEHNEMVE